MKHLTLISLALLLGACKNETTYSVQYYLDHRQERKDTIAECQNNPGEKEKTPNCKNAMAAEYQALIMGDGTGKMPIIK